MMIRDLTRRNMMKSAIGAGMALATSTSFALAEKQPEPAGKAVVNGRIKQSVCQWCYKWPMEEFCAKAQKLGLYGIDLVEPDWFETLKKYGLVGTMTPSHSIPKGLNRKENWDECLGKIRRSIEATSAAGFPCVICFSGNRKGMADDEGMKNCEQAVKQVVSLAEQKKVTLCMELLNSKRTHKDYMCDHTAWGAELVDRVGSDRFKLLYDIFHMQIDEGDVIATIRKYHDRIAHYHTGGVPGRHELDENQELQYPAIMRAIHETGFDGVVGQEFVPTKDPYTSLFEAVKLCDV